jgi:predicted RNA binding protein YcfA (HicA-like mRNA interferase family)
MPKIPGIPHLRAVRALEKAGFHVARQGKHIVMTDGRRILTVPRHDPVDPLTMGGIVHDSGLTPRQFRELV